MTNPQALQYIINAMSLRTPQAQSLVLFSEYLESDAGQMMLTRLNREHRGSCANIENATKAYVELKPETKDFLAFERTFPAYTFALATGVGKTRLMGAFVAYLHLVYGIQHFMVVAPGNTIYRKLVEDFSRSNNPKYVFRGIEEINSSSARVITKDNFEQNQANASLFGNEIQINIFNIQQFAQKDIEQEKGITKFSETLGESYFDYLSSLNDLVVLMDESHHYHADAALGSLDRIDPLFGLEFTATPYTGNTIGRGKTKEPELMKNIFYSYPLGNAIRDGFVKDPWVGTEADVNFNQWDSNSIETDARKLQLAAYFHERTKTALKEYAYENNKRVIKPVMLVVAKDITHASELRALIDSDKFRGGAYMGKVIEVHTKTKGEEADETIEKLISLEDKDNIVEIVIHVNMLKEGWDVANIYTIAPIRSSASEILTEQTIGRGLRLPYGERTGNKYVDRVMIVAHDNYAKIIEQAKDSKLIQPTNIENVTTEETKSIKQVIEVQSAAVVSIQDNIRSNEVVMKELVAQAAKAISSLVQEDTPKDVIEATIQTKTNEYVEAIAKQTISQRSFTDFNNQKEAQSLVADLSFEEGTLFNNFSEPVRKELQNISRQSAQAIEVRNIAIPRLILTPNYGEATIEDFDLNTSKLTRYSSETSILTQRLQAKGELDLFGNTTAGAPEKEQTRVSSLGEGRAQSPENTIIAALVDFPLVDYEDPNQTPLLLKLANQATEYYRTFVSDDNSLKMMIENNFRQIAKEIYDQIVAHNKYLSEGFLESTIGEPRPYLDPYNISKTQEEKPVTLESQINRFSKDLIYTGFSKACHSMYRFDSSDEVRLAYLLDKDPAVEDWLRPSPRQFEGLFWRDELGNSHHRYEPDFVVELENKIVLIEVKPGSEIDDFDVQAKKTTAERYCEIVTKNVGKYGITKPWEYVILKTERITITSTIGGLLNG